MEHILQYAGWRKIPNDYLPKLNFQCLFYTLWNSY